MVICLERGAHLHMAQLMLLPLILSLASVKSRLVLPFWYRLTRVVLEKGPLNGCVCVCVCVCDYRIGSPASAAVLSSAASPPDGASAASLPAAGRAAVQSGRPPPGAVRLRKVEDGQRRGELGQHQRRATLTVRTAYQRAQLRYDSVA